MDSELNTAFQRLVTDEAIASVALGQTQAITPPEHAGYGCPGCGRSLNLRDEAVITGLVTGAMPCCGGRVEGPAAVRLLAAAKLPAEYR